jgi:transcription elongation factor Elf1
MIINAVFTCPDCKGHRLEEIMVNVTVASEIIVIHSCGYCEYGEPSNDCGVIDRYQCLDCGFMILTKDGENITDPQELFQHLTQITTPTYWKCPKCNHKTIVDAYELATIGVPVCDSCGDYDNEMEPDQEK